MDGTKFESPLTRSARPPSTKNRPFRTAYSENRARHDLTEPLAELRRAVDHADRAMNNAPPALPPEQVEQVRELKILSEIVRNMILQCKVGQR